MSNLVDHAKSELARLGNDKDFDEAIIKAVEAFASYGHSGGSASYAIPLLNDLLQFHHITPITSDPSEWIEQDEGLWQSRRDPNVFSDDGGKTFWNLEDGSNLMHPYPRYRSEEPKIIEESADGEVEEIKEVSLVAEVCDIPEEFDTPKRLRLWMTAEKIVENLAGDFDIKEYKGGAAFGHTTTYTQMDQYIEHIIRVAEWLEGKD